MSEEFKAPDFSCLDYTTGIWTRVWGTPQGWMKDNAYELVTFRLCGGPAFVVAMDWRNRWAIFQPQFPAFSPCLFHNVPSEKEKDALILSLCELARFTPEVFVGGGDVPNYDV